MSDKADCTFLYFKPGGKWKYVGRGVFQDDNLVLNRDIIMAANGGVMPGLADGYAARELVVILVPDQSCEKQFAYPRMLVAEE